MNAAIRASVRAGVNEGWDVLGVRHGYRGLISGDLVRLGARDVGGIIDRGGTLLHTARCPEFETGEGQLEGLRKLAEQDIDALIVIGGDGSQAGACSLSQRDYPVVGIASTIDNDLYGSEVSIGVNTALNTALESIDRLRTTASAHNRAFVVEVMGRNCGYLALISGITGGAESIVIPEVPSKPEAVAEEVMSAYKRGKSHALVVVAEGAACNAESLAKYFRDHHAWLGFDLRVTRLGHVQRGGIPSAFDRLLATRLGAAAIEFLAQGVHGVLVGLANDEEKATSLSEVVANTRKPDLRLLKLASILAA